MLGTVALPAILLPPSLRAIGGDLDTIRSLLEPLQWALWVGAIVLFLGVLREGRGYVVTTFQRFVLVEMAEAARRDTDHRGRSSTER